MTLYTITAALFLEEKDLIKDIGDPYIDYTHQVPAFCPVYAPGCYCSKTKKGTDGKEKYT